MKDFVTYEQALELKELGFDEPCLAYWYNETPTNPEGQCLVYYEKPWDNQKIIKGIIRDYYYTPTYSQAFRFFREKHGLWQTVLQNTDINWTYDILPIMGIHDYKLNDVFETYEEAELACLNKLIEIVKNKNI